MTTDSRPLTAEEIEVARRFGSDGHYRYTDDRWLATLEAANPAPAGLREGLRAVLRDFDREPTEGYLDEAERIFRAANPAPAGQPSAEPYYLPLDCPVCGRRRMQWDGTVLSCEKCTTSSAWDGFTKDRYAATRSAPAGLDQRDIEFIVNCIPWERDDLRQYVRARLERKG